MTIKKGEVDERKAQLQCSTGATKKTVTQEKITTPTERGRRQMNTPNTHTNKRKGHTCMQFVYFPQIQRIH